MLAWRRALAPVILACAIAAPAAAQDRAEYLLAVAAVRQGNPGEAIPILEKFLAGAPRDLQARNLFGIALMNAGRKAEAAAQFQKALAVDANFAPALKNLGIDEMELRHPEEARGHFTRFLQASPSDAVVHLYMGELEYAQRRFAEAVRHYQQSGGMHLKDPQPLLHFAEAAMETRDREAASRALAEFPETAPPEAHFQAGLLLARAEKYAEAATQFRHAQGGSVDAYQAGFNLVLTSVKAGQFRTAINAGEAMISQGRKTAELYNLLGSAYNGGGQKQQAYEALRTATRIAPDDEANYLDLARLAIENNNAEVALEICGVAAARIPQSYQVRMQLGASLALTGRLSDAEKAFGEAARLSPGSNIAYVAVAMVQMQSGKVADAVHVLRGRRAGAPEDYLVNRYLGEALSRAGVEPGSAGEKEAVAALETAVRVNPSVASPRALLGKLLFASGNLDGAAEQFEASLRLDPGDASPAYQLALIYRKRGNTARADELFDLFAGAKKAQPGDAASRDLLRAIGARYPTDR